MLPASTQVDAPVAQEVVPSLQIDGFEVQLSPEVHEAQVAPLVQTMLVPQLVPGGSGLSSMQVEEPVAHEVVPV